MIQAIGAAIIVGSIPKFVPSLIPDLKYIPPNNWKMPIPAMSFDYRPNIYNRTFIIMDHMDRPVVGSGEPISLL